MNRYAEEKKELMKSMEEQKAKLQESEKNLVLLKETMSEMDEQLEVEPFKILKICYQSNFYVNFFYNRHLETFPMMSTRSNLPSSPRRRR